MVRSLWTGASGMIGQQSSMDAISNNLSNVNTPGFKRQRAEFEDLLYQTIRVAGTPATEDTVVPVVAPTRLAARAWRTPLGMVFVDGGHSLQAALTDYRSFAGHIVGGGLLAVHDLFPDPATGGQAPITIYRLALASGLFEEVERVKTLGILRRLG